MKWRRIGELTAYASMGPVSGPLAAGMVRSLRNRRPVLAGLYAVALVEAFFLLPYLLAKAIIWIS